MNTGPEQQDTPLDVVIVGGGLAGSSAALLLRRSLPKSRVRVIECAPEFERKVGEATVEVSGFFLAHVLKLHKKLSHEHLFKHGLRYYFTDGRARSLEAMTEVGATSQPSLASFQLDRARLDESVLQEAQDAGAEVVRPARVKDIEHGWPLSQVEYEVDGSPKRVQARWVIDATGRNAHMARRMGLLQKIEDHKTSAMWGHWRGTLDLDGVESQGCDPEAPRLPPIKTSRLLATNHFCGHGWWAWVIPLVDGATSIGVVFNRDLFEPADAPSSRQRYEDFCRSQDGLREIVEGATLEDDEFRLRNNLPYHTTRYMDLGWAMVGDAAAFIDPYYSPGLDHLAMSVYATTRLIQEDLGGELSGAELGAAIDLHNERFQRSISRWFDGLYRDKYELLGDAELTAAAFYIDTAMYYLGVVQPVYRDTEELRIPTLGREGYKAATAYRVLRFVNRRLVKLARNRQARGTYGRRNVGWRSHVKDFGSAEMRLTPAHRKGLRLWISAELHNIWTSLKPGRTSQPAPMPGATPAEAESAPQGLEV